MNLWSRTYLEQQTKNLTQVCSYQLRNISTVRHKLNSNETVKLIQTFSHVWIVAILLVPVKKLLISLTSASNPETSS